MSWKTKIKRHLFLDKQVEDFYYSFQKKNPGYTKNHKAKTVGYIMKLNRAQHKQQSLKDVSVPKDAIALSIEKKMQSIRYFASDTKRKTVDELYEVLQEYDVISFDIFDTALYRKVEFPNDVFLIMASEIGYNDFPNIRKRAEDEARRLKEISNGTREVVLSEIYDVLDQKYHIAPKWQEREIELELDLAIRNEYIYTIYQKLCDAQKTLIFTSDMYLPKAVIEKLLKNNGYERYSKLYLSNEYNLRKGDGSLQKILLKEYKDKKIIHIGDSQSSDIDKSLEVGLDAIYNSKPNMDYREADMDNIAGSFYRSIINNNLNNGLWDKNLHFEHGFRVGGILTVGYCKFLNNLADRKNIDKILFCARDCEIVWKVYNKYFKQYENDYVEISRHSIMNVTAERYLYDLTNRSILRYAEQVKSSKTIEDVFVESGYAYLVEYLENDDIDKYLFPVALDKKKLNTFIFNHKDIIAEYNKNSVAAAKKYFSTIIGDAKNILIVDIGWTGTCISALKYFLEEHFPERDLNITGALMCTSRNNQITNDVLNGTINAYIYSPVRNLELARYMMPAKTSAREQDLLHMPLEFLFTSAKQSLAKYSLNENGEVIFERARYKSENTNEIEDMQDGIIYFAEIFSKIEYMKNLQIPSYVAFNPLKESINQKKYCYAVYKNFTYDAFAVPFVENGKTEKFGELFDIQFNESEVERKDKRREILFVTPELIYTGAPRSLLRMCKVAKQLGYYPVVWSAKPGPFIKEFEEALIDVKIVPENKVFNKSTVEAIKKYDMAVCNTIVTDKYARICSYYIPTVWYIREATNIPDFIRKNPERAFTLKYSKNIYCVSDYAAEAIQKYTKNKVSVIHNCVEDEVDMALPYRVGSNNKVRFVQFGTIEYRKGYDVLLAAYLAMPKEYQEKAELYFAGGFINSGTSYCDYLFSEMDGKDSVHYLGVVKGEKNKIETLSSMDVVVVASRDESCSLVALEGAMLSKPLIVTENVGAKYMVHDDNGIVVKTADVDSLKNALMKMIDSKNQLYHMGVSSRKYYETLASMESYTRDMEKLFLMTRQKNTIQLKVKGFWNRVLNNRKRRNLVWNLEKRKSYKKKKYKANVIVSLTSHPGRILTIDQCIKSLLEQTVLPQKILLWLSQKQFPTLEHGLPKKLLKMLEENAAVFELRWTEDDLAPHKKYYYTMKEYPEFPIIIVDDDVIYDTTLVEKLMESYKKYPDCVSCMRANLIMFKPNGELRSYNGWLKGYTILLDQPSYQLLPTGVGGVLYPPKCLPVEAFDSNVIKETCHYCDDLWLKVMSVHNGYRTVVPSNYCAYEEIDGTQDVALWRKNVDRDNNDISMEKILNYYDSAMGNKQELLRKIRKDRFS